MYADAPAIRANATGSVEVVESRARWITASCRALCWIVVSVWALAWLGWGLSMPIMTDVERPWPQINPVTALLLGLLATSILASSAASKGARTVGQAIAAVAAALSAAVLLEYLLKLGSGADLLLWGSAVDHVETTYPGRPSPETAVSALVMAIGILLLQSTKPRLGTYRGWLVLATTVLPVITLLGFLFSAVDLLVTISDNRMTVPTALSLLALAAAATLAAPSGPPMTWLASTSNRLTVIWLALSVIALPLSFRAGDLVAEKIGAAESADAIAVLSAIAVTSVGVILIGIVLRQLEKRGERRFGLAQDRERAVLMALSDGFADLSLDGTILSTNPAADALFGSHDEDLNLLARLRIQVLDNTVETTLTAPEILQRLRSGIEVRDDAATLTGTPRGDIPVSVLLFPIKEGTTVKGFGATLHDVSERVEADRKSRRFARAVDASSDAIYVTNPSREIEYVNAAFTTITGWPPEDVLGRSPLSLLSDGNDAAMEEIQKRMDAREVWSGRLQSRRRVAPTALLEGSKEQGVQTYWAQSTIAPYFDEDGLLLGFVALQRDVTELVQRDILQRVSGLTGLMRAEMGLALATREPIEDRINAALKILVQTLDPNGEDPCTAWLEFSPSQSPPEGGADDTTFRQASADPLELDDIERSLGRPVRDVSAPQRLGGAPVSKGGPVLSGVVLPLGSHDNNFGRFVVAWRGKQETHQALEDSFDAIADMFMMAIAEEDVRRARQSARVAAEEAGRAKSQFLANMSHEIRTPMNGVLGMLDMLAYSDLDAGQQEHVSTARASAESLLIVINDILDFSKIEAGKLDIESIAFDVHETTEQVAALYGPQADAKGLRIRCVVQDSVPRWVRGDPTRLRQILSNLIGNAVKFTLSGGIDVNVEATPLPRSRVDLQFAIRDTGIGMRDETRSALFDAFIQADTSTTREFGGTGLGLAITHELITLMGGTIDVTSELGVGTIFTVHLPLPVVVERSAGSRDHDFSGGRVLVVDDNDTSLSVLCRYLEDAGVAVEAASDGPSAVALLRAAADRQEAFEVAVIDLQLAGLDAPELGRQLKSDPTLSQTRLIRLSSVSLPAEVDSAFDLTLLKPVRRSTLNAAVRQAFTTKAHDVPSEHGPTVGPPVPPAFQGRVLLVEDNLVNQRVARGMLARLGLEVAVADDGQMALDQLADNDFDAVLMDCQMPVLDGFEATKQLRQREGSQRHTPVVATTADVMVSTVEACLDAGMDTYLSKPYTLQALAAALRPWINASPSPDVSVG